MCENFMCMQICIPSDLILLFFFFFNAEYCVRLYLVTPSSLLCQSTYLVPLMGLKSVMWDPFLLQGRCYVLVW